MPYEKMYEELICLQERADQNAHEAVGILEQVVAEGFPGPWPHLVDYACQIVAGSNQVGVPPPLAEALERELRQSDHSNARRALERLNDVRERGADIEWV